MGYLICAWVGYWFIIGGAVCADTIRQYQCFPNVCFCAASSAWLCYAVWYNYGALLQMSLFQMIL